MATKGTVGQLLVEMRAELGGLRTDVKEMETIFKTSFGNVTSMATSFGKILGASFGVGAVMAYGRELLNLAGHLKDLSEQTGISGRTLSGLKSTLEESGTSLDAFAKGIFTVQKNLGGIKNESDPAAQAVKALGLNLDKLREADTEKFLEMVTDALGKVENPLNRNALGAALLGKSFRELGPALMQAAGHLDELRKSGLSDEDIDRLDKLGDEWTRFTNKVKFASLEAFSSVIKDLQTIKELITQNIFLFSQWANKGAAKGAIIGSVAGIAEGAKVPTPKPDFKALPDDAALKKSAEEMKRLVEGIQKSNVALQAQIIELESGKEAADAYTLAQKEMEENSKGISAELRKEQDRRRELTDQLRTETVARQQLKLLIDATRKATPGVVEDIVFGLTPEQQNELSDAENKRKIGLKEFREEWAKLQSETAIGAISDDTIRRLAELGVQFDNVATKIREVGEAAGMSEDDINNMINAAQQPILRMVREIKPPLTEGDKLGAEIAGSITQGMKNTLMGIETGQQTLGEGMKNLVRNMLLELQGAVFDKAILEPLKAIASGFISGLVGALDSAANDQLKSWAKSLGQSLSQWLGGSLGGLFGGGGSGVAGGASMSALDTELGWVGFARGGMIPSFASGGLFIGHGGEFVMQKRAVDSIGADKLAAANQTGKLPGSSSGATKVTVEINGDITPRQPNMTPDQVVKVTAGNITNDGMVMSAIESRLRMRGR